MAFGGRELRLILSIQSYGTGNIQRLRRDIMSLQTATDIANRKSLLQARIAQRQTNIANLQQEQKLIRSGVPYYLARNKAVANYSTALSRQTSIRASQIATERKLFDLETQRIVTRGKLASAKSTHAPIAQIQLLERTMTSLDMQEASLTLTSKSLDQALFAQRNRVALLDKEYKDLVATKGAYSTEVAAIQTKINAETAALKMQEEQVARLNVAQRMQLLQQKEIRARSVAHAGRIAQFAGLIGLAGFSLAATAAANFNKELVLAATQARNINAPLSQTIERTKQLENGFDKAGVHFQGILELMQQFPASAEDMAKASYDIYSSMRISFGGGLTLLKQFNQLAVATGSDLATATSAGITVLNNFSHAGMSTNEVLNLMVATIRFGRMRLDEFNQMLGKVAPAAKNAGQSFKDVAGAMALITTRQPSTTQGATQLARLLQTFSDPDFQRGTAKFGVDITRGAGAVGALKPLPEIIDLMNKAFGTYTKHGGVGELFKDLTAVGAGTGRGRASRIEAQRGYLFLIKSIRDYRAIQLLTTTDTTEFTKSLKAMSAAPGVQWQIFINQMRAFIIVIGQAALPALLKLAGWLSRVAGWFESLSEGLRSTIVRIGVFTAAFLLLGGTLVNVGASLVALAANWKIMRAQTILAGIAAEGTSGQLVIAGTAAEVAGNQAAVSSSKWLLLGRSLGIMALAYVASNKIAQDIQQKPIAFGGVPVTPGTPEKIKKAYAEYLSGFSKFEKLRQGALGKYAVGILSKIPGTPPQIKSFKDWLKEHPRLQKIEEKQLKNHGNSLTAVEKRYHRILNKENAAYVKSVRDQQKQLLNAYNQQNAGADAANQRAVQIAKAHTNAMQEAMRKQQETIKAATDNLMGVYDQMRQQNEQALGGIFQGPTMSGILGGIFSGLNDQLRQFGVQIPIPFAILKKDMDQSLAYAKRWFRDIGKLRKAGVPEDVITQIEALGPQAGIPIVEGMLQNGKKGAKKLGDEWHKALGPSGIVTKQTQKDMNATLAWWKTFGEKTAWQMAQGIINNPYDAQIRKNFQSYIKTTFGDILAKQAKLDAAAYMKNFTQDLAAGATPTGQPKSGGRTGRSGRIKPLTNAELRFYIKKADIAEAHLLADIATIPTGPHSTAADARRYREDVRRYNILVASERGWRKTLAQRRARAKELASIRKQMHAQSGLPYYSITYEGTTINHIKADGATPNSVMKALNKAAFRKKNRRRPRRTGGG